MGKQIIEVDVNAMSWIAKRISECKFCDKECPVPQDKRNLGCHSRPVAYMKECPILRAFNKKSKMEEKNDSESKKEN